MTTTSLLNMLRDTLPIHAAWTQAQRSSGGYEIPPADHMARVFRVYHPTLLDHQNALPPEKADNSARTIADTFIWNWKMSALNEFADVCCRSRTRGYAQYKVANRIRFGFHGNPFTRVTTKQGVQLDLPLSYDYLISQFSIFGGIVNENARSMWPLEMNFDSGVVMPFVYEPTIDGRGVVRGPVKRFTARGAGSWQPVIQAEKDMLEALLPEGDYNRDGFLEAMTGPMITIGGRYDQTRAKTGDDRTTRVSVPRIVVVISFGTCRERSDFEPGGIVGMARVFPNLMVWSNIPLKSVETSVYFERPSSTTMVDGGNGRMPSNCCDSHSELHSLAISDVNDNNNPAQLPFWGGTFAYVRGDPHYYYGSTSLRVVDHGKAERNYDFGKRVLVARGTSAIWPEVFGGTKVWGQGDFDNVHIAPRLKLDLAKVTFYGTSVLGDLYNPYHYAVNAQECDTENVWMAPFCAHDCFHVHWRWGRVWLMAAKWTFGWDRFGPFKTAGAPMVPHHQEVWLEMTSPTSFYYHATSVYGDDRSWGYPDPFCHHGAAYAIDITSQVAKWGNNFNVYYMSAFTYYDSANKKISPGHKHFSALLYWLMRYHPFGVDATPLQTGRLTVQPRNALTEDELERARSK